MNLVFPASRGRHCSGGVISLEHGFNRGSKIGLSLPTLETGSRPFYSLQSPPKESIHLRQSQVLKIEGGYRKSR